MKCMIRHPALVLSLAAVLWISSAGCGQFISNQTAERTGNIGVQFINSTPYRASFSFGTYDALDETPGPVALEQLRLDPNQTSAAVTLPCRRNMTVGTEEFVKRVLATKADQLAADFDPEAFSDKVNFSAADAGTPGSGLPTEGTANGFERLLGVDYGCADLLIFTFVEDGAAPGGFRIDYQVLVDDRQ